MPAIFHFLCDDEAATAVEYAVMLALILLVTIGAISAVGGQTGHMWSDIQTNLDNSPFGG